jgi:hypothetical protein
MHSPTGLPFRRHHIPALEGIRGIALLFVLGIGVRGRRAIIHNNRIQGNVPLGTAPTAIGATSNPTGLQ